MQLACHEFLSSRTLRSPRWPIFQYDADKFRELVLYIAHRCAENQKFGDTRLNKVLFFSDAFALQHLGQPITARP
jgi:hypothetical protein